MTSPAPRRSHRLKTWPDSFAALRAGKKPFEYRRDDRPGGYQIGDFLDLAEWDPSEQNYTGAAVHAEVTHVLRAPKHGVPDGFAVLGLADVHVAGSADCYCGAPDLRPPPIDRVASERERVLAIVDAEIARLSKILEFLETVDAVMTKHGLPPPKQQRPPPSFARQMELLDRLRKEIAS